MTVINRNFQRTQDKGSYSSFNDFYYFYLGQHSHPFTRRFHFLGVAATIMLFLYMFYAKNYWYTILLPVTFYLPAWIGHYYVERNKPATFKYPLLSFISDFRLFFEVIAGQRGL